MKRFFQLSLVLTILALVSGSHHDYVEYMAHWDIFLKGGNPWVMPDGTFTGNAYGPPYLLYAFFYWLHPF